MMTFRRNFARPVHALLLALLLVLIAPAVVLAQDEETDQGFITRLLEDNLSGAGRSVHLEGFKGALSSRATFTRLTIADDEGVWLTIENGAMQWNRRALLLRRVEIAELSAERIELARLPVSQSESTAEAGEFALPTLPVSILVEGISADQVTLGPALLGEEAVVSLQGAMVLSGGAGEARLAIQRQDDKQGTFGLNLAFSNETRALRTDVKLDEGEGGIVARLIGLEGEPPVSATIKGEGTLSDFTADLSLTTDGQPRVTGQVALTGEAEGDGTAQGFRLRLGGDLAALLPAEHRDFFGTETQLLVQGSLAPDGALAVPVMLIDTAALNLSGGFALDAGGAPQTASLLMTLGEAANATTLPTRLPFGEVATTVQTGRMMLSYDRAAGDGWTLTGALEQVARPDMAIGTLALDGAGQVHLTDESKLDRIDGNLKLDAAGLAPTDPGLAEALGEAVALATGFDWTQGGALKLHDLKLTGADYGIAGEAVLDGLASGLTVTGDLRADYDDLSRLSTLAGRPLTGAVGAEVKGHATVLTGAFGAEMRVTGQDITADQPQLDRLLAGTTTIALDAQRDSSGIEVSDFSVDGERLTMRGEGTISSADADLRASLELASLATVDPGLGGTLAMKAAVTGPAGARRLMVNGEAMDLQTGISHLDAVLGAQTGLQVDLRQNEGGFVIEALDLENAQLTLRGQGNLTPGAMDARIDLNVPDLTGIDPAWGGSLSVGGTVKEGPEGRRFALTGTGEGLGIGDPRIDGLLAGTTRLDLRGMQNGDTVTLDAGRLSNAQAVVDVAGLYGPGRTDLQGRVELPSLRVMGPGYSGAVALNGRVTAAEGGHDITADGTIRDLSIAQNGNNAALAGETLVTLRAQERGGTITLQQAEIDNPRLRATGSGRVGGGDTDLAVRADVDSLAFLGRGLRGGVTLDARLRDDGSQQTVTGTAEGRGLGIGNAQLDPLLAGVTRLDIDATRRGQQITARRVELANGQLRLSASGDLDSAIRVDARLNDLGLIVREFPGSVTAQGTLTRNGNNVRVDLRGTGPGAAQVQVAGTVAQSFSTANLTMTGSAESAMANPFLRVRSVQGPITFNLAMNGRPGLETLSGRIGMANGSFVDPKLGIRVDAMRVDAGLNGGRITLNSTGEVAAGGRLTVGGSVDLTAGRSLDLTANLDNVVARDPNLYTTRINGQVTITGLLADGPLVSGTLHLSDTELRIPSTGLGGARDIPEITHINDTRPVRATRAKAGLLPWPSEAADAAGMTGPAATPPAVPARLDLTIEAPSQVFIRGRGVDAEMGGRLRLTGRANNVIPVGMFELIRGRVDLLGKRFDLTEGLLELQGSMIPVIRLVAQAEQDGITTRIIIDGDLRDPEITFTSDPDMPQEEVLSQLLFGRGLDKITPMQAAQLANAVAVLAGSGSVGIVGKLRESVGLDDLDLATDDQGNVSVRAGKYLSENLYTDVVVDSDGTSTIEINLDISHALTARGSVASDGTSGIGLFYERDY